MYEPICKYFDLGIVHFMAYPDTMRGEGPVVETVREIACDEYFNAIELTHIADDNARAEVRDMLAASHMRVCYGAQPRLLADGLNPNNLFEDGRLRAEQRLLDSIDEAAYLGAGAVAFLAGKYDEASADESYERLLFTTKNVCAYAKTKNISICLEVFDFDLDKKSLIGPAPLAAAFAADMRKTTDNFGLMVDLSHIPQTRETAEFVIRCLRPYIAHLHIGSAVLRPDAEAFGDTHPRFGFPGGVNDTPEVLTFLRVLKNEGFFDENRPMVLSFEVKPWKNESPQIVIANAKRVLNRAWAML